MIIHVHLQYFVWPPHALITASILDVIEYVSSFKNSDGILDQIT